MLLPQMLQAPNFRTPLAISLQKSSVATILPCTSCNVLGLIFLSEPFFQSYWQNISS